MEEPRKDTPPRIRREKRVVAAMIAMYCRDHHGGVKALCADCAALHDYAMARLDRCVYGGEKPACKKCPVHCYKPALREQIRVVMRYAGPRMVREHPLMALQHLLDSRKEPPERKKK